VRSVTSKLPEGQTIDVGLAAHACQSPPTSPTIKTTCRRRSTTRSSSHNGRSISSLPLLWTGLLLTARSPSLSTSRAFTSKTSFIWDLKDMVNSVNSLFKDSSVLGSFISNHDSQSNGRGSMGTRQGLFSDPPL